MNARGVTYICWTPTALSLVTQMNTFKRILPETVKKVLFVGEVFPKEGELYAKAVDEDGRALTFRLYPVGEDTFCRMGGFEEIAFGDGCLTIDGGTVCERM